MPGNVIRAATKKEQLGDVIRGAYESVAKNPVARISDLLGLTNFEGITKENLDPSGIKMGQMPGGPGKGLFRKLNPPGMEVAPNAFKISKMHEVVPGEFNYNEPKVIDNSLFTNNASGDSMASTEALNRMKDMSNKGQTYQVRQGNTTRDLIGPEAVDYKPRKGEQYGIRDREGAFRLLQRGQ